MAYRLSLSKWILLDDCLQNKGITYDFKPSRNDGFMYQTGNPEGLAKYHIHSIEYKDGEDMIFDHLLAKSGNWRGGEEPDLALYPRSEWVARCEGMDSSTIAVVEALRTCFDTLGAIGPVED